MNQIDRTLPEKLLTGHVGRKSHEQRVEVTRYAGAVTQEVTHCHTASPHLIHQLKALWH